MRNWAFQGGLEAQIFHSNGELYRQFMKLCEPKKPKQGVCTQRPYSVCSSSDIPCSSRVGTMIFLLRALCYCAVLLRVCVCVVCVSVVC